MPLSDHEQRMLDQLEQQLEMEDPKFVSAMQVTGRSWSVARVFGGAFLVLAGLGVLIGAVSANMLWLGIVGFALMLAGAWLGFSRAKARTHGKGPADSKAVSSKSKSITSKFEERWERRQRGNWPQS